MTSELRAKSLEFRQFSFNRAILVLHPGLFTDFKHMRFAVMLWFPYLFRFRVRQLTNWISHQSSADFRQYQYALHGRTYTGSEPWPSDSLGEHTPFCVTRSKKLPQKTIGVSSNLQS